MVGSRVYVGGLPYGVRERDLERFFKGYGRTRDILIKNGYGFVVSCVICFRGVISNSSVPQQFCCYLHLTDNNANNRPLLIIRPRFCLLSVAPRRNSKTIGMLTTLSTS